MLTLFIAPISVAAMVYILGLTEMLLILTLLRVRYITQSGDIAVRLPDVSGV